MNEKQPEQIDRAQILRLAELVREQAENSYNADRPLTFSEMALISRSCDEIVREISKPERQHGRWIKENQGGAIYSACSECGAMMNLPWFWYCGKCGARMDGGSDGGKV